MALPVRGTLIRRGFHINPTCPLCLDDIESMNNLFKGCLIVQKYENVQKNMDGIHLILFMMETRIFIIILKRLNAQSHQTLEDLFPPLEHLKN